MARIPKPAQDPNGRYDQYELLRILASKKNPDGTDLDAASDWTQYATGTAALATATRAAEAGKSHYVTAIEASYGSAQIGTLTVRVGATVLFVQAVHNQREIPFPTPLKIPVGESVTAELSAGAAGVVGRVALHGYTA